MVSHTPTERDEYESSLKARRDQFAMLSHARESGRSEGRSEGRLEGLTEGRVAEARLAIVQLGQLLMGTLTEPQRQKIETTTELDVLQQYLLRLHPSRTWDDVLNDSTASVAQN